MVLICEFCHGDISKSDPYYFKYLLGQGGGTGYCKYMNAGLGVRERPTGVHMEMYKNGAMNRQRQQVLLPKGNGIIQITRFLQKTKKSKLVHDSAQYS
jgi:hypothetical protein